MNTPTPNYFTEANAALVERLQKAVLHQDWDAVEAAAYALYEYARSHTVPSSHA